MLSLQPQTTEKALGRSTQLTELLPPLPNVAHQLLEDHHQQVGKLREHHWNLRAAHGAAHLTFIATGAYKHSTDLHYVMRLVRLEASTHMLADGCQGKDEACVDFLCEEAAQ